MSLLRLLLVPALLFPLGARAAEVTEMPPALRGDVSLGYGGTFGFGGVEEAGEVRARQRLTRHDLRVFGEFSPVAGIAVGLRLPITPSYQLEWREATQMRYDPVSGSGTYVGGEPLDAPPVVKASGLEGVWLHAAFAPFSETYALKQQVTWRLEAGFRPPSANNFWRVTDEGTRGIAPGGAGWRLAAAFSTDRGVASPYLQAVATIEGKATTDLVDPATGDVVLSDAEIDPASSLSLIGGVELVSSEDVEKGTRFSFDLRVGFGYRGWQDIPSGVFLPQVLDASKAVVVTESEHLTALAGIAAIVEANEYLGFRIGVEGHYVTPHRVENVYAARTTADTFAATVLFEIEGRIR